MNSFLVKLRAKLTGMVVLLTVALLVACGEKSQQPPPPKTAPAPPFQQQRSALDKSRGVDQTVQKSSEELRQDVEQQTK